VAVPPSCSCRNVSTLQHALRTRIQATRLGCCHRSSCCLLERPLPLCPSSLFHGSLSPALGFPRAVEVVPSGVGLTLTPSRHRLPRPPPCLSLAPGEGPDLGQQRGPHIERRILASLSLKRSASAAQLALHCWAPVIYPLACGHPSASGGVGPGRKSSGSGDHLGQGVSTQTGKVLVP
jgi:hypothetical protein